MCVWGGGDIIRGVNVRNMGEPLGVGETKGGRRWREKGGVVS